ncbi:hypothetical protein MKW98_005818, partial [Papaver atlanticum]
MEQTGTWLFPAINVNDSLTKSKELKQYSPIHDPKQYPGLRVEALATVLGLEFRGLEKIIYHASGFRRSFGALLCRLGVSVLQGLFCICYLPTAKGQALADECGIKFIAGVCNKSKCGASSLFLIRCSYTLKRRRTPIYNEFRNQNLGAINSV